MKKLKFTLLITALLCTTAALAQEAVIRKNLMDRYPTIKSIDEVKPSAIPGLFEVSVNKNDIIYSDPSGTYMIQGALIDTKSKRNLTDERIQKLTAIKFADLPLKDSFTIVRGNGSRKLAVFEDPNCGYCKKFERDLQGVTDITIHLFLLPILGADSVAKARSIWCSKDPAKTWQDWMVRDQALVAIPESTSCDTTALTRNLEISRTYRITGTPTLVFTDGTKIPGAVDAKRIEATFAEQKG